MHAHVGDAQCVEWPLKQQVNRRLLNPAVKRQAYRPISLMRAAAFKMEAPVGPTISISRKTEQRRFKAQPREHQAFVGAKRKIALHHREAAAQAL